MKVLLKIIHQNLDFWFYTVQSISKLSFAINDSDSIDGEIKALLKIHQNLDFGLLGKYTKLSVAINSNTYHFAGE